MSTTTWGLVARDYPEVQRRVRTFGVGASVRAYNNKAVPGLGGVWFAKQLFLAALGVGLAEDSDKGRHNNIQVANAVEALACWLAYDGNGWNSDGRLLGITKMSGQKELPSYQTAAKPWFYVTQPMRMSTVQPLPALGLVQTVGSRFNAFSPNEEGRNFVRAVCEGIGPVFRRQFADTYLVNWVRGENVNLRNDHLVRTLSPVESMPQHGRELLKSRLQRGGPEEVQEDIMRRRNALQWVEDLRKNGTGSHSHDRPPVIDEDHWLDLQAGAAFFKTTAAADKVLNQVELVMNSREIRELLLDSNLDFLEEEMRHLRECAQEYLRFPQKDDLAAMFCQECLPEDNAQVLEKLVGRDGHILRLSGENVRPGSAYDPHATVPEEKNESDTETAESAVPIPSGISYRIRNLFLLNADLEGDLDRWTSSKIGQEEAGNE